MIFLGASPPPPPSCAPHTDTNSHPATAGFSSGNSLAFGRYVLFAAGSTEPDGWTARYIAIACVTFSCLIHSLLPKWGMRLFDVLGVFKVVILIVIAFAGFAALAGHVKVDPKPDNFTNAFQWDGIGGGVYNYATALLRIVYSYKGWENANYVRARTRCAWGAFFR